MGTTAGRVDGATPTVDRPLSTASTAVVTDLDPRTPLPLACTLGPQDGRDRLRRWQELHRGAPPVSSVRDGVLEVRYPDAPGVLAELRALAAAEQSCCSFVDWSVARVGDDAVLTVRAPAGRLEAVEPIAALFAAGA